MKFRAHDTFYIRKGWLYKGMKNVERDPLVFMGAQNNPMDVLGIGSNMVKALRYWLQATCLTFEPTGSKRYQMFTDMGEIIYDQDRYMEEMGTLWLIHYKLCGNKDLATAWYFFFHHFTLTEFNREDFVEHLGAYISQEQEDSKEERMLRDEFSCICSTYLGKDKGDPDRNPETNLESPFSQLGLIRIQNKSEKTYKKVLPSVGNIHPLIALAVILDNAGGAQELKLSSLLSDPHNLGKSFNLDIVALTQILSKLETRGYLKVVRTAGLDVVLLSAELVKKGEKEGFLWCIRRYYQEINL